MDKLKKLTQELEDRFDRWEHLKEYGGSDPFYEDGSGMNLVRNHIGYRKNEIKELCEKEGLELPKIYYRKTPPEVDKKYMARADEIRRNAKRALAEYKVNKDYQYLLNVVHKLNKGQIEQISINTIIGYCKGLENYIEEDDLVAMRRHERYERYLKSFLDCRKEAEDIIKDEKPQMGQVSLFDLVSIVR